MAAFSSSGDSGSNGGSISGGATGWTTQSPGSSNAATPWAHPTPPARASEQRSRGGSSSSGTASPRSGRSSSSSGSGGSTAARTSSGSSDRSASQARASRVRLTARYRQQPAAWRLHVSAVGEAVERTGSNGGGGGGGGGYPSYPYYPYYPDHPLSGTGAPALASASAISTTIRSTAATPAMVRRPRCYGGGRRWRRRILRQRPVRIRRQRLGATEDQSQAGADLHRRLLRRRR